MYKIVLVRHGESTWNKENKFTGWTDVPLSENGIKEASKAGKILKANNFTFDLAYTSYLIRARDTLNIILEELNEQNIEIKTSWKLNERHYGALQGLNKKETSNIYGENQVHLWRRSLDELPPLLEETDHRHPIYDEKYSNINKDFLPSGESLKDTMKRTVEYWNEEIVPSIKKGKKIIISAHGNSLRSLISYLDNLDEEEIMNLELDTGKPVCYELNKNLKPIKHYYVN